MRYFKVISFSLILLVISITMSGCDASKILDTITKVASAVTEAMPKIKEVVNTVTNAIPKNTDAADNTTPATNNTATEQNAANNANVKITSAGDDEEVGNTANPGTTAQPAAATGAASTATQARIASSIRGLLGSTSFRGADVDGGNLACAKVVSTALKNAGVLSRVSLNCDGVVADLRAVGWQRVNVPPYQEGDVVTWTTSRGPGRHIGIIVKNGSSFQAISNSSSERTPRVNSITYMPITQVLRKV
ncbi:MAG TPA: hypothetical protein PLM07_01840 [Candidatus Rifleibacterium sp.]|nr:hypothetical protein [Candidatus Rifleibacterium sp.]HPT44621.1 hypothetical protein [Candidatus Rifleibacterium sp.]